MREKKGEKRQLGERKKEGGWREEEGRWREEEGRLREENNWEVIRQLVTNECSANRI